MTKPMTVRLSEDQQADLAAVARVDGTSIADAVRTAVDEHIAARRTDLAFRQRLERIIDRDKELLERLAQ